LPAVNATRARTKRGFALLITITLLAFLVLLLVSLASLTRVETSVAANNQSLAQARQNALLALNIAVGQLQKYAGPDARVTARAEITSSSAVKTPYFTGVWDAAGSGSAAGMWLVSGSEKSGATAANLLTSAPDPSDDTVTDDTVFLVGNQSVVTDAVAGPTPAERTRRIKVAKQDITAPAGSVPGLAATANPRVGRYAWWVGDQGVKASLALPDRADEVTYAPWYDADPLTGYDQRSRLHQQIGSSPNYFRASTAVTSSAVGGFDPLTNSLLSNVQAESQMSLLDNTGALTPYLQRHYHDFTTLTNSVLANTLPSSNANAGLLHDISLKPDELGAAFSAYVNYPSYMETPGQPAIGDPVASPAITSVDSPRRRYRISTPVTSNSSAPIPSLAFGVAPVITELLLQFSVESSAGCKVGLRAYVGLWNPYTSSLVPPNDLYLTISGLPQITASSSSSTTTVDLQADMPVVIKSASSTAMQLYLPFTASGSQADRLSWLPGRIYGWRNNSADNQLVFYDKNITSGGRWYYNSKTLPGASTGIGVSVPAVSSGLTVELRNSTGLLATYTTPAYISYSIPSSTSTKWFGYGFRMKQASNVDKDRSWLRTFDPHAKLFTSTCFEGFDPSSDASPTALNPAVYNTSNQNTVQSGFLIYRIQGTTEDAELSSYNDAPLFELPRLPLLSLGELQHMTLTGTRPYAIGNSWGGDANAVFDRFFFSGLPTTTSITAAAPNLSAGQPLPNWNLKVVDTSSIGTVQMAAELSSRYLLQSGGFNINSTSVAAWRAVLSGMRFKEGEEFKGADIDNTTSLSTAGTQKSSVAIIKERFNNDITLGSSVSAPIFFRFPQSAQETYFWQPPSPPSKNGRTYDTYGFRLGVRGKNLSSDSVDNTVTAQNLTTDQIEALATEIVSQIRQRAVSKGPFRNLHEFLNPLSGANDGTPSLLESAIATVGLNPPAVQPLDTVASFNDFGFSSLTLTQADILGALAPYLRARSDTFIVRGYGEALNPVTNEVAGKAWLEATVQRFPEVVDTADDIAKPTGPFGRRFKIISFRWLSPSDI
jgi:hypothetical protein